MLFPNFMWNHKESRVDKSQYVSDTAPDANYISANKPDNNLYLHRAYIPKERTVDS